ncbi:MAG: ATP-binding cassette domain-containing protein [Butyricicoccus sp.]|nr:ATP-binding cassette domain-containing protein [Butyricicoccus sp.]
MIELRGLGKTFTSANGPITALRDINLTISDGEIFGIIGLSGAGKSTLVRCINLLERPTEGHVIIDGQDLTEMSQKELLKMRRSIGMIFQGFNLLEQRNVTQNICYPLEIAKVPKKQAVARAEELLELVGLTDRRKSYPSQLSGGQKQRVAIARALATNPKYLLCDEATSALDPATTQSILELLKEINRSMGVTIVVITHEMRVIDKICDKVAVIDSSEIAEAGEVKRVFTAPKSQIARELVMPNVQSTQHISGGAKLRLVFNGESSYLPVVSNLVMESQVPVNILFADTRDIDGHAHGQMLLQLPDDEHQAERAFAWLDANGVTYSREE